MAIEPINYLQAVPQQDFLRDIQGGLQLGLGLRQAQQQQAQQELAQQQAKQYQADVLAAMSAPTPQAFSTLALKYPQQREAIKQAWDGMSEVDRKAEGDTMAQAYSALLADKPEIAAGVIRQQIDARKNSGLDTSHYDNALQIVQSDPKKALGYLGFALSHINDPKAFATQFAALGGEQRANDLAPAKQREAEANAAGAESDATIKQVQAKYAEPEKLLQLEGFRTDMQFKKDQTKIGYLNAKIAKERNDVEKQRLQIDLNKAITERDDKVRAKVADAESAASSIDNMLNNIDRILKVATDKDGKPTSTLRAAAGPLDSRLPTMQGDVADLEALTETLGAQAFLSQIPNIKGMGALSNAEGEKLQTAFQNFSLKQSPEQIIYNLREAKRLLGNGRSTISKRYGVPLGNPNTPASADKRPPLSSFGG